MFKFKLWGFSTARMAFITIAMSVVLCLAAWFAELFFHITGFSCDDNNALVHTAMGAWMFAFFFCLLPPYNATKLRVCWPLTALSLILITCSVCL